MLYCWFCKLYFCAGCKCFVLIWWIVLLCQLYLLYYKLHWFIFTVNVYHSILWSVTVSVLLALFWLFCFHLIYITRVILVLCMIGWKPHDLTYPHRKPQCRPERPKRPLATGSLIVVRAHDLTPCACPLAGVSFFITHRYFSQHYAETQTVCWRAMMRKVCAVGDKHLWKYAGYSKLYCLVVILKKSLEAYEILYGDRSLEYKYFVWNNICALKNHKYGNGVNIQACIGEICGQNLH
jgi:hypothetical protein